MTTKTTGNLFDRDPAEENATPAADPLLHNVFVNKDAARQRAEELKTAAEHASHTYRFWQDLGNYLTKNWPLHVFE